MIQYGGASFRPINLEETFPHVFFGSPDEVFFFLFREIMEVIMLVSSLFFLILSNEKQQLS